MAPALLTSTETNQSVDYKPAAKHQVGEVLEGYWRKPEASPEDVRTVQVIRGMVLDCYQQWGIGHGGRTSRAAANLD